MHGLQLCPHTRLRVVLLTDALCLSYSYFVKWVKLVFVWHVDPLLSGDSVNRFLTRANELARTGVFCTACADGCTRNNGYSNREMLFSVRSVYRCYKQDK
jgi:hypothetical protein